MKVSIVAQERREGREGLWREGARRRRRGAIPWQALSDFRDERRSPELGSKPHELMELGAERFAERGSGSIAVAGAQVASTASVSRAVFLSHTNSCPTM